MFTRWDIFIVNASENVFALLEIGSDQIINYPTGILE